MGWQLNAGEVVTVRASSCMDNGKGICTSCSTIHEMPVYARAATVVDYSAGVPGKVVHSVPRWLDEVLAQAAVLDLHHPDARAKLAAALVAAAGVDASKSAQVIAETIRGSAEAVLKQKIATTQLKQHLLIDAEYSKHVAREIGNNAAGSVVLVLALGEDE